MKAAGNLGLRRDRAGRVYLNSHDVLVTLEQARAPRLGNTMWIGMKRVAFLPVRRAHALPPDNFPPSDWPGAIRQRVLNNPDAFGSDQALRT